MLAHHLADAIHVVAAPAVPNPKASVPPGVDKPLEQLLAYVKWGVLFIIIAAAFVGTAAIAGGRALAHHGSSKIGTTILMSAFGGAVLYVGIYALITSVTN
ncbi:hypothetical protein GCM10023322_39300 [Rugosimonospora acidiphila]|uniref:Integral membrane protein n=1 Tax=Rugosimonospora acidiphila TaxID=556531 RepID=A0ABP9RWM5_9ACTN